MSEFLTSLLTVEARSGRIEGIFAADPELGRLWRGQAAITEACRSVSMEDIHVLEGDVVHRRLENRATSAENARGVEAALDILKILCAPGDIELDPMTCLRRAIRATVSHGGGPADITSEAPVLTPTDADAILSAMRSAPTPFLSALRASIVFRQLTESWSPSVERILFTIVEGSARRIETGMDGTGPSGDIFAEGVLGRMKATWTMLPATALTRGRYRAWSPISEQGILDLAQGISDEHSRVIGAIPVLRRWRDMSFNHARAKHGKSRLKDLVALVMQEPLLTSSMIRNALGVSERASLYLAAEAEEAGILRLITPRRSYRVWALPFLGDQLRMRQTARSYMPAAENTWERGADETSPQKHVDGDRTADDPEDVTSPPRISKDEQEEREARILAELDAAMAKADAVLEKYAKTARKL